MSNPTIRTTGAILAAAVASLLPAASAAADIPFINDEAVEDYVESVPRTVTNEVDEQRDYVQRSADYTLALTWDTSAALASGGEVCGTAFYYDGRNAIDTVAGTCTGTSASGAPPAPTITSTPPKQSNSARATFEFTGQPGASFQCGFRGEGSSLSYVIDFEPCSSPATYELETERSHTFVVRQVDQAGKVSKTAEYTWSIWTYNDWTPWLHAAPAKRTNSTSARFSWMENSSKRHECRLDGGAIAACSAGIEYTGLGEGAHEFEVREINGYGNTGPFTGYKWTIDVTPPPKPQILEGPDPVSPDNWSAEFAIQLDESEYIQPSSGAGYYRYECTVNGASYGGCQSTTKAVFNHLTEGEHTFRLRQADDVGNWSETATYTWVVDTTGPPAPRWLRGYWSSAGEALTNSPKPQFEWGEATASERYECSLDGGAYSACGTFYAPGYGSYKHQLQDVGHGRHTFRVRQVAGGVPGNARKSVFTVDLVGPDEAPVFTAVPESPGNSTNAAFEYKHAEGRYECKLDAKSWGACSSSKKYDQLPDGQHTFSARARDRAGNPGPAASHTWTIDNAAWALGQAG